MIWYPRVFLLLFFIGSSTGSLDSSGITLEGCGWSTRVEARIVGGQIATRGAYPWMVSLFDKERHQHICGGSILNENWIVTSAHCVDPNADLDKYIIYAGLYRLHKREARSVRKLKISRIVLHESYVMENSTNDIALLQVKNPIHIEGYNGWINGICLPENDMDPTGWAYAIGWGETEDPMPYSYTLRKVSIPIVPRKYCKYVYHTMIYNRKCEKIGTVYDFFQSEITEDVVCAGTFRAIPCGRDSGGPLFQMDSKGVATLIGITSFSAGCGNCSSPAPAVFTRVSKYTNWMRTVIEGQT